MATSGTSSGLKLNNQFLFSTLAIFESSCAIESSRVSKSCNSGAARRDVLLFANRILFSAPGETPGRPVTSFPVREIKIYARPSAASRSFSNAPAAVRPHTIILSSDVDPRPGRCRRYCCRSEWISPATHSRSIRRAFARCAHNAGCTGRPIINLNLFDLATLFLFVNARAPPSTPSLVAGVRKVATVVATGSPWSRKQSRDQVTPKLACVYASPRSNVTAGIFSASNRDGAN